MATYAKGLARRASLTEGSAKAAKSYKAKVASLTSERAGLQAQIRELTEELVKHRSDLKHARQEALEAGNSMECLTEELGMLRMDLARPEALASRRGEVITELKDEVCTKWAFGWLAFQLRASQAFPNLEFNIQLSNEEVEESASEAEVDAGAEVFSGATNRAPLPGDSRGSSEG